MMPQATTCYINIFPAFGDKVRKTCFQLSGWQMVREEGERQAVMVGGQENDGQPETRLNFTGEKLPPGSSPPPFSIFLQTWHKK